MEEIYFDILPNDIITLLLEKIVNKGYDLEILSKLPKFNNILNTTSFWIILTTKICPKLNKKLFRDVFSVFDNNEVMVNSFYFYKIKTSYYDAIKDTKRYQHDVGHLGANTGYYI